MNAKVIYKPVLGLFFSILIFAGCSRKKDSFLSRNYHAVTTEFNVLYNGNTALEQGKQNLIEGYNDNYWEILPIERMEVTDKITLSNQSKNASFETAEVKAVKAIQKHGMNINGRERNPQIDEAYLLLGKARYYDQRFVPALDAFNNILSEYPTSDKINYAKIWREKANIRLENNKGAIKNLKRLLEEEELEKQDLADATSMLAQAYINTRDLDSAITQLEIAANVTKNNDERGRFRFIQGQLYNAIGKRDSANYAFDKVIDLNRKSPRVYMINAYMEKAKNFDFETENKDAFFELLKELEDNRENRPFLDKIYYQIGEYHLNNTNDSLAILYYNNSLRTNSPDKILKANNYETLGNINFDKAQYKIAGAYYDSTLTQLKEKSKRFRAIKKKRDNLDDVIYFEDVAKSNDSILKLLNMNSQERINYFSSYITELKKEAKEEKEKAENIARNTAVSSSSGIPNQNTFGVTNTNTSTFYFYNPITVAFGKNEFVKTWGDRQYEDNWRWSIKNASIQTQNQNTQVSTSTSQDQLYDPQYYISKLPTNQTSIDSIIRDRNFAYYKLGLIYSAKFKEYTLAKERLEDVLAFKPEERLVLPSKYNLYKIYGLLNQTEKAERIKNDIINDHPDSRYAAILRNPNTNLGKDENSPENIYKALYLQFETQHYQEVILQCNDYITQFDGEEIIPKFEYLKAVSKGRLEGFEAYKEALNYILLNYPSTTEGKKAEDLIQNVIPKMEDKTFADNASGKSFKTIFQFNTNASQDVKAFKANLDLLVKDIRYFNLTTSKDIYNANSIFVVVHGFKTIDAAQGFSDLLLESHLRQKERTSKINKDYFVISSPNYQIIQIHKNINTYKETL